MIFFKTTKLIILITLYEFKCFQSNWMLFSLNELTCCSSIESIIAVRPPILCPIILTTGPSFKSLRIKYLISELPWNNNLDFPFKTLTPLFPPNRIHLTDIGVKSTSFTQHLTYTSLKARRFPWKKFLIFFNTPQPPMSVRKKISAQSVQPIGRLNATYIWIMNVLFYYKDISVLSKTIFFRYLDQRCRKK